MTVMCDGRGLRHLLGMRVSSGPTPERLSEQPSAHLAPIMTCMTHNAPHNHPARGCAGARAGRGPAGKRVGAASHASLARGRRSRRSARPGKGKYWAYSCISCRGPVGLVAHPRAAASPPGGLGRVRGARERVPLRRARSRVPRSRTTRSREGFGAAAVPARQAQIQNTQVVHIAKRTLLL